VAAQLALSLALASVATISSADAYDAAMAHGIAAKEKAVDSNDPSAWQEALRLFVEADAVRATKESKYELAFAASHLKEDDLAVEAYEAAIAMGLSGKAKDKADAFVKEHAPKMARIAPQGPPGAIISINGRIRGKVPVARPIVVFAGSVHVAVSDGKGKTITDDLVIAPGETANVDWTDKLAPKASDKGEATGGGKPAKKDEVADREVPVEDLGAGARTLGWTLIVAGGSLAVAGGVTTVIASSSLSSRRDSLADNCLVLNGTDSCPTAKPDRQADAKSDVDAIATWKGARTAGVVALGAGATLAAVGLVRLLTAPKAPQTTAIIPRLDVSAGGVSFGFTGAF
jgi:hypothetical protein